jgi:hypothetical protein
MGGTNVGPRYFVCPWIAAGGMAMAWGPLQPSAWYSFGGNHTAIILFGYCDGSVRPVNKIGASTDWFSNRWYYNMYIAGKADNSVVNWDVLGAQ